MMQSIGHQNRPVGSFSPSSFGINSSFRAAGAFTLVELIVVISIIFILSGLVFTAAGYLTTKAGRTRAEAEITALTAAIEAYKNDNGTYPRDTSNPQQSVTDNLNAADNSPQVRDPAKDDYRNASQFLYGQLSGDYDPNAAQNNSTDYNYKIDSNETTNRVYFNFPPSMLSITTSTSGNAPLGAAGGNTQSRAISGATGATGAIGPALNAANGVIGASPASSGPTGGSGPGGGSSTYKVNFIRDPFGFPYGYSTAGQKTPNPGGYNSTYDLWSTAGTACNDCSGKPDKKCCSVAKSQAETDWIKNW